jgi:hypothetical protein
MLALYWARIFFIDGADVFELDFGKPVTESILFILAILAVYSVIGTVQGTREYYLVQKRLTRYHALMRQLERINERASKAAADKAEEEAEAEAALTRPRPAIRERLRPVTDEGEQPTERYAFAKSVNADTSPLIYKNPFPPRQSGGNPQRQDPDGANTGSTRDAGQNL